jgi:hypothetical protein
MTTLWIHRTEKRSKLLSKSSSSYALRALAQISSSAFKDIFFGVQIATDGYFEGVPDALDDLVDGECRLGGASVWR